MVHACPVEYPIEGSPEYLLHAARKVFLNLAIFHRNVQKVSKTLWGMLLHLCERVWSPPNYVFQL